MKISVVSSNDDVYQSQAMKINQLSDYYLLLHDFDTEYWNYRPRSLFSSEDSLSNRMGYPEMVPFYNRKGMPLTREIQWYWFNLCVRQQYHTIYGTDKWNSLSLEQRRRIASEWSTLTDSKRFATNGAGTDINRNYITEAILREEARSGIAKQFEVACGGNVVKAVSHNVVRLNGKDHIQIEVWDGHNPSPNPLMFNHDTHPHLVHYASISTPYNYQRQLSETGPYRVDAFPFFNGAGSPYALYFSSPNYVLCNRVRRLSNDELVSAMKWPYIP